MGPNQRILIIHAKKRNEELLKALLLKAKATFIEVGSLEEGYELLEKEPFDAILADESIPSRDLKRLSPFCKLLTFTQNASASHLLKKLQSSSTLIAESPVMLDILCDIEKIARSDANVFITGESGTGKEVIASLIHEKSKRSKQNFIKVNCAALPDTLIESEFFGHEKGAFTGAISRRIGRFERADDGTLLLDEISELPLHLQAKLLRIVQEQEFERLGGHETIRVNVRLISTSNRSMEKTIKAQEFREDLYYRLSVIPIHLPPLRERREDIIPLAYHFLRTYCRKNDLPLKQLSAKAEEKLLSYFWPGNIRQLAHVIEHTVVLAEKPLIQAQDLPLKEAQIYVPMTLHDHEMILIKKILDNHGGNRTHAARELGISVRTLRNKLSKSNSG